MDRTKTSILSTWLIGFCCLALSSVIFQFFKQKIQDLATNEISQIGLIGKNTLRKEIPKQI